MGNEQVTTGNTNWFWWVSKGINTVSRFSPFFINTASLELRTLGHQEYVVKCHSNIYSTPHFLCFSFYNTCLLLPRCPDGYFGPRCLQTEPLRLYMPNPFKSMFTWNEQLRTETQLALDSLSVDPCCPLTLPSSLPLSPLSPSQVITQWAVHYTMYMVVSSIGTLCFCCL